MGVVQWLALYRDNATAATRHKLKADASRTGKEVKDIGALLQIDKIVEHVEEVLFGKVCRGACLEITGHLEGAAFVFSANYSHAIRD